MTDPDREETDMTTERHSLQVEQNKHDRQLDAIIAAYYRAVEAGECIDQKDFIAKHPEVEKVLNTFRHGFDSVSA